jgi:hypothetical protein
MSSSLRSFGEEMNKLAFGPLLNAGFNALGAVSAVNEGKAKMKDAFKAPSSGNLPLPHWSQFGYGRGKVFRGSNQLFRTRIPL